MSKQETCQACGASVEFRGGNLCEVGSPTMHSFERCLTRQRDAALAECQRLKRERDELRERYERGSNCVKCPRCTLVFGPWYGFTGGESATTDPQEEKP